MSFRDLSLCICWAVSDSPLLCRFHLWERHHMQSLWIWPQAVQSVREMRSLPFRIDGCSRLVFRLHGHRPEFFRISRHRCGVCIGLYRLFLRGALSSSTRHRARFFLRLSDRRALQSRLFQNDSLALILLFCRWHRQRWFHPVCLQKRLSLLTISVRCRFFVCQGRTKDGFWILICSLSYLALVSVRWFS